MTPTKAFARFLALALAVLAVSAEPALAKKKPPPPPPPPAAPPPEPEITVGPPVLAAYVIDTASAFATYMRTAAALPTTYSDGPSISAALKVGSASEQHQMQQGLVAYAAIAALQDPTFVETVRKFAKHASTRDQMVRYLHDNPAYVMTLDGHDTAAARVAAALGAQALRLKTAADLIQHESLAIQLKADWSKKPVPDPGGRLQQVKQLSSVPLVGAEDLKAQLAAAATGASALPADGAPQSPAYTQAVNRGLAVAALAVLGKAGEQDLAGLMPLLIDEGSSYCFSMAKLNLYQCLAVAKPYYEDMYCLGLHAMGDVERCVLGAAGMAEPAADVPPFPTTPKKGPSRKKARR